MTLSMDRLPFFASVVECGSFTEAARSLGVAKNVVSHQVASLERELGATLLLRTTRKVRPTEEGARFYERISTVLRQAEQAVDELTESYETPKGVLRVTAPLHFGTIVVVPTVKQYLRAFPDMKVELSLEDRISDLITDSFDLSIRVGWPQDSSNIMRKIADVLRYPVASPQLVRHLDHPRQLADLPYLEYSANRRKSELILSQGDQTSKVTLDPILRADTTTAIHAAAKKGIGVAIMSDFHVADDIKAGQLVRLLPDWELPKGGIYVQYPPSKFRVAKSVRFFETMIAFYQESFRNND